MLNKNNIYVCETHEEKKVLIIMSPCRGKCKNCKEKKVNGYQNPDHISNPFGYLYLIPNICDNCSEKLKKCKWC
jgi:hypothetical protein